MHWILRPIRIYDATQRQNQWRVDIPWGGHQKRSNRPFDMQESPDCRNQTRGIQVRLCSFCGTLLLLGV